MSGRPESKFTKWFTRILVEDGAVIVPIVGGQMQSGWPDRLVVHRDWQGLVEVKARDGRLAGHARARDRVERRAHGEGAVDRRAAGGRQREERGADRKSVV